MFLKEVKSVVTGALRAVFDAEYDDERFRDLHITIEYPVDRLNYPALWVDFEPVGELQNAGIGHIEYLVADDAAGNQTWTPVKRWTFQGFGTVTIVALTSLERDDLFDAVLSTFAFGDQDPALGNFRAFLDDNDYIALDIGWEHLRMGGAAVTQGTPWGTDENIYEMTVSFDLMGEFVAESVHTPLVPLSAIQLRPYTPLEPDPTLAEPDRAAWS